MHIRNARENEAQEVQDLTLLAYGEYAAQMRGHYEQYAQSIIATLSEDKQYQCIVAEQGGNLVGSALLFPVGSNFDLRDNTVYTLEHPELRLLAVAPSARGKGIGAALVMECARRAKEAGSAALNLHTTDMMQTAMRMYERLGFERAPETDFNPMPGVVIKGYQLDLQHANRIW